MFLASSVATSLRNNQTLDITNLDLLTCPVNTCTVPPDMCRRGQDEACEKTIYVVYEHDGHNKVVLLRLYYQLKGYDREGFIKPTDRGLNILLNRGLIQRTNLIESRPA